MSKYRSMESVLNALLRGDIGPNKCVRILCNEFDPPRDKARYVTLQVYVWRYEKTVTDDAERDALYAEVSSDIAENFLRPSRNITPVTGIGEKTWQQ